jgi:hypothetical protein
MWAILQNGPRRFSAGALLVTVLLRGEHNLERAAIALAAGAVVAGIDAVVKAWGR